VRGAAPNRNPTGFLDRRSGSVPLRFPYVAFGPMRYARRAVSENNSRRSCIDIGPVTSSKAVYRVAKLE
jgi:hypothetical protein